MATIDKDVIWKQIQSLKALVEFYERQCSFIELSVLLSQRLARATLANPARTQTEIDQARQLLHVSQEHIAQLPKIRGHLLACRKRTEELRKAFHAAERDDISA